MCLFEGQPQFRLPLPAGSISLPASTGDFQLLITAKGSELVRILFDQFHLFFIGRADHARLEKEHVDAVTLHIIKTQGGIIIGFHFSFIRRGRKAGPKAFWFIFRLIKGRDVTMRIDDITCFIVHTQSSLFHGLLFLNGRGGIVIDVSTLVVGASAG